MPSDQVKPVFIRLPADLTKTIKRDAFENEETLREWFQDAAEQKLRQREEVAEAG